IEELALHGQERQVIAARDRGFRERQRLRILREGARVVAEKIARELVEDHDEREVRLGRSGPGVQLAARRTVVQQTEASADAPVEGDVLAEPLHARASQRIRAEPEIEDRSRIVRRRAHRQWSCGQRLTSTETWTRDEMPARRWR